MGEPFWETQLAAALGGAALTLLGALVAAFITGRQAGRDRDSRERQAALDRLHGERLRAYTKVSRALDVFDQGMVPDASLVATSEEMREYLDALLEAAREAQLVCSPELGRKLEDFIQRVMGYAGPRSITWVSGVVTEDVRDAMRRDLGA